MRFKRRLNEIEAVCWTGDNIEEVRRFADGVGVTHDIESQRLRLDIGHGYFADPGDWVVRAAYGNYVIFQDAMMKANYEPVGGENERYKSTVQIDPQGDRIFRRETGS